MTFLNAAIVLLGMLLASIIIFTLTYAIHEINNERYEAEREHEAIARHREQSQQRAHELAKHILEHTK